MGKQTGFSLIEVVVFILVAAVAFAGILIGMNKALFSINTQSSIDQATFLANAYMEIIALNRQVNGVTSLTNPCPGWAACTPLSSYATSNNFTVTPAITGTSVKTVTITIGGDWSGDLVSQMANYEQK